MNLLDLSWLRNKISPRRKPEKEEEEFRVASIWGQLEKEGFRPLVKGGFLDRRLEKFKNQIPEVLGNLLFAESFKDKKVAIIGAYLLVFENVAWLRTIENRDLASKINDFLEQVEECINNEGFAHTLVTEAASLFKEFVNLDVEPLRPLIVHSGGMGPYVNPRYPSSPPLGERKNEYGKRE